MSTLFVDDDRDFLDLAARLLEDESDAIDVSTDTSPESALSAVAAEDVDCVVSDYEMTEMDGLEFLRAVREADPTVPFILFTGTGDDDVVDAATDAGATDYVVRTGSPDQYAALARRIEIAASRPAPEPSAARRARIDEVRREVSRAVFEESSRRDVYEAVCDRLAGVESHRLVWIGDRDESGSLTARATAGEGETGAVELQTGASVEYTAFETGSVTVEAVGDETETAATPGALGAGAVLAVPISHRSLTHGVLAIYASDAAAFDEVAVTAVEEIGELLGFAISAGDRRRTLATDASTAVELRASGPSPLSAAADAVGRDAVLENAVERSDGGVACFLRFESDAAGADEVQAAVADRLDPLVCRSVLEDEVVRLVVVVEDAPFSLFAHHGVEVRRAVTDGDRTRLWLSVPPTLTVGDAVSIAEQVYDSVELRKRRHAVSGADAGGRPGSLTDDLTPRQREVLETAYRAGFFEWPREMSAEEIAGVLDISQPAFSHHLRNIEQTVFGDLVESAALDDGDR